MIRLLPRLIAAVPSRKNLLFSLCAVQASWRYTDSGPPEPKKITVLLPARIFLPMPRPEHVPLRGGPAPEEGMPRVSG